VVPTYRPGRHIESLLDEIKANLHDQFEIEVLLVEDWSSCAPNSILSDLRRSGRFPFVRVISLAANIGQAAATVVGLGEATNSIVVTIDDDLEHKPSDIPILIGHLLSTELDFVVARLPRAQHGLTRRFGTIITMEIARLAYRTPRNFHLSSFMVYRKTFLDRVALKSRRHVELGWMFRASRSYVNVDATRGESARGSSTYTSKSLFAAALPYSKFMALAFSRIVLPIGFLSFAASVVTAGYYMARFFIVGTGITGFTTLATLGLANFGVVSLAFSVLCAILVGDQYRFESPLTSTIRLTESWSD
jgi:dolichol-phosphate mannosyltransferase/undecaprenyl-phosphate 4-deoxy-4-formamido-L-arabinose transferase